MNSQPGAWCCSTVLLFLFYFVTYTIIIFSNTAIVGAAMMRMRGETHGERWFHIASERLGKIFGYAAISATIGMILIRSGSARGSKTSPSPLPVPSWADCWSRLGSGDVSGHPAWLAEHRRR
jgi:hypothetical protein